jgi:uncharacterized protein YdaU (DUF1376 family)
MSAAPYVPFYTSDFLGGTSGMTAASKGVYITLLCLMYESEEPLPQSWDTLARRCGCTLPAFKRSVEALQDDGKIIVTGAGIWSEKCEKHIMQRRERQSSAAGAAKKRWEKIKENQCQDDKTALSAQCQPEPEPYKEKEDTKVSSKKKGSRLSLDWVLPSDWCEWALSEGLTIAQVRDQAERFRDYWTAKPGQSAVKLDWKATWRNWIRNAKQRGFGNNGKSSDTGAERAKLAADRFAARRMGGGQGGGSVVPLLPARYADGQANGGD